MAGAAEEGSEASICRLNGSKFVGHGHERLWD